MQPCSRKLFETSVAISACLLFLVLVCVCPLLFVFSLLFWGCSAVVVIVVSGGKEFCELDCGGSWGVGGVACLLGGGGGSCLFVCVGGGGRAVCLFEGKKGDLILVLGERGLAITFYFHDAVFFL